MIRFRARSLRSCRLVVFFESGFQNVANPLECRYIGPKMLQRFFRRMFQPLGQLMITPEKLRIASAGNEGEWLVGVFVNRWVKFADNVVQYSGRKHESSSAVTVVGRVADAVDGVLRKENGLVYIGCHTSLPEMHCKSSVTHQDDTVILRLLLGRRAAFVVVAAIICHAEQRTLVQAMVCDWYGLRVRHKANHTRDHEKRGAGKEPFGDKCFPATSGFGLAEITAPAKR